MGPLEFRGDGADRRAGPAEIGDLESLFLGEKAGRDRASDPAIQRRDADDGTVPTANGVPLLLLIKLSFC